MINPWFTQVLLDPLVFLYLGLCSLFKRLLKDYVLLADPVQVRASAVLSGLDPLAISVSWPGNSTTTFATYRSAVFGGFGRI